MIRKVEAYIQKMHMIQPHDTVYVGLSGGADSVCLFLLLLSLSKKMDFNVEAIHVEHGIRGEESKQDASFVERLCGEYQVPLTMVHIDVLTYAKEHGLGVEEAARILRYDAFLKNCKKHSKIALAHHMDDDAETVLFQMARGSGVTGLCGILPVREEKDLTYIRPLLPVSRQEIENFLYEEGQVYRIDSTNEDIIYSRNRIRQNVLPELRKVNGQAVLHIYQMTESLREVEDFIATSVQELLEKTVVFEKDAVINLPLLKAAHPVLQKELLLAVLARISGCRKDIGKIHVDSLLGLMEIQSGRRMYLPYDVEAVREHDSLRVFKRENVLEDFEIIVDENVKQHPVFAQVPYDGGLLIFSVEKFDKDLSKIPKNSYTKWFNYDKIKDTIVVRNRREKDFFTVDEMGHKKKLKEYFIDQKVPVSKRSLLPLVAIGHEILWMPGGRTSENYRVDKDTEYILIILYDGGN